MAGLYLHIPFCRRKCAYCDFYSFEGHNEERKEYPDLLTQHLRWAATQGAPETIETVYFGGGTPSLLPATAYDEILNQIGKSFTVAANAEITLEVNPGTVSYNSLADYRAAGVNRLSLGLQTCNDRQLHKLGRLHSHKESLLAVQWARQAGFDNLSLDLMFALPGQSRKELQDDLDRYLELSPQHLSCYGLSAESGTVLQQQVAAKELDLPDEDFYADAFMLIHEQLSAAGYDHYEIANYGQPGFHCRHNETYWQRRPYLGIGAGAHSFVADNWGSRWQVPNDLDEYRQNLNRQVQPAQHLETFDYESALKETVYLALRTQRGVRDAELRSCFNCSLAEAFPDAVGACSKWLVYESGHWSLTPEGWLIFDHLIQHFL